MEAWMGDLAEWAGWEGGCGQDAGPSARLRPRQWPAARGPLAET